MAVDYMKDYNEAQASGHHVDCDGYRTAHRVEIVKIPYSNGSSSWRAVCEECGPLTIGSFGDRAACVRLSSGHAQEVRCTFECLTWD